jgi:hypothetical protein
MAKKLYETFKWATKEEMLMHTTHTELRKELDKSVTMSNKGVPFMVVVPPAHFWKQAEEYWNSDDVKANMTAKTYEEIGEPPNWSKMEVRTLKFRVVLEESVVAFDQEELDNLESDAEELVYDLDLNAHMSEIQETWLE